jgi:hypothetical protein
VESERPWIPPYQVQGRLSQARNDKLHKIYVVIHNNEKKANLILCLDGGRFKSVQTEIFLLTLEKPSQNLPSPWREGMKGRGN